MAKGLCWLGLQDAARKKRRASQQPEAWAGSVIATDGDIVTKSVTQERWEKTQNKIRWLGKQVNLWDQYTLDTYESVDLSCESETGEQIHFKTTKSFVGFIQYVAATFTCLTPYLKGIYLTKNCWRKGRDERG